MLGVAVASIVVFAQFVGEPTTERARPLPATSQVPAVESIPTPTALQVPPPSPTAILLPDGGTCPSIPGDHEIGDTVLLDLDADGDTDAVAPRLRLDALGGVIEFGVYLGNGDCTWTSVGQLSEGPTRDEEHNIITYSWTCSTGQRSGQEYGTNLVQVSENGPESATTLTQFSVHEGRLVEHWPTLVEGSAGLEKRSVACDDAHPAGEPTTETSRCGGQVWELKVPDGWLTTAAGDDSCSWFTPSPMSLPCFCDASPAISIGYGTGASRESALADLYIKTTVDGYPAQMTQALGREGMGGIEVNTRSYVVDLGGATLSLSANSQDWLGDWDDLAADLDRFVAAIDIRGWPLPTMGSFYPEFPHLDPTPLYVDPAGAFAWYRADDRSRLIDCEDPEPGYLARLSIASSRPDDLHFTRVGPVAAGVPRAVHRNDDGTLQLTVACVTGDESGYLEQSLTVESTGAIAVAGPTTATSGPRYEVVPSTHIGASPDGIHRYTSGDHPLGLLDYGCTLGSQQDPKPAQTMMRYTGDSVEPAFPDVGRTGRVQNMRITSSGFAIWESHSCQSVGLHLGRIADDGSIVDRHLVAAQGIVQQSWTVLGDELIVITPRWQSSDPIFPGRSQEYPALRRIDMVTSPPWVITADPPLRMSDEPVAPSFSGDSSWRLGENRVATGECAGDTIYADEPAGPRRVSNYAFDIDGSVVDVLTSALFDKPTSAVDDTRRVVVALVECPSQYDGVTVWVATETAGNRVLRFKQNDFEPVRSVEDLSFHPDSPSRILLTVELLDGTRSTVDIPSS